MARFLIIAYSNYIRDGRVKRHAEALAARGDSVDVICLAGQNLRSHNGVNVIGIDMPRYRGASRMAYLRSYLHFFTSTARTALRLSRARRYDAAIVCSMPDAMVMCALPLKLLGTRLILDVHDTMPELYQDKFGGRRGALGARLLMFEERASAWVADRVLAVHDPHRLRLESAGIPSAKIRVVLNSPDPAIFSRLPHQGPTNEYFTIVCHGTITRRLGLDIAFEALDLLRAENTTVRLMLIGSGDYLEKARALAAAMKLEDRVTFLAPIPIEELPALLKQADAGLIPNRPNAATHLMLPAKMLEYATLGIPIIAARLRTPEHYFGETSVRFFEAGNPEALADAIRDLRTNRGRAVRLARHASQVAAALGWERQREHYFEAIDSLFPGRVNGSDTGRLWQKAEGGDN